MRQERLVVCLHLHGASCDRKFADPALATLRKLGVEGLPEPAILLLMYRESYRR
jgi:hypothetical protein